jgi:hypothetical protein
MQRISVLLAFGLLGAWTGLGHAQQMKLMY